VLAGLRATGEDDVEAATRDNAVAALPRLGALLKL
jgi:hypothetical protein